MSFARSLATVSGLTIVSRVGGFIRDTLTAMLLGAGPVADAFFVAQRLPNLFRSLFAEGAFSAAFVPLYTTEQERHGEASAQKFAGDALAMLLAILIPFSVVIMFFMPYVMRVIGNGFEPGTERYLLAVAFSQITFPYLTLISVTALQSGVLNAHNRFGPGAFAPVTLNIVMIIGLIVAHFFHLEMGTTLSWALTVSGVVQMGWLAISCWRAGLFIPLTQPRMTGAVKKLFRRIGPGALGSSAAQVNLFVSTMLATQVPNAVSWLYYADRLQQLPLGIIGIAVGTTLLPTLSRHVEAKQEDKVRHYMSRAIEFCLVLGLPATIGLAIAGKPIIQTLWEHGRFGAADTHATAIALAAYSLGIPPTLLVRALSAEFFARHDTSTPVKIAFVAMAVNVIGAVAMLGPLQHLGIALANSLASWVNATLLFTCLRKRAGGVGDAQLLRRAPRIFIAAGFMALLTWALVNATAGWMDAHRLGAELAALTLIIGGAGLGYGFMLHIFRAVHLGEIWKLAGGRRRKL